MPRLDREGRRKTPIPSRTRGRHALAKHHICACPTRRTGHRAVRSAGISRQHVISCEQAPGPSSSAVDASRVRRHRPDSEAPGHVRRVAHVSAARSRRLQAAGRSCDPRIGGVSGASTPAEGVAISPVPLATAQARHRTCIRVMRTQIPGDSQAHPPVALNAGKSGNEIFCP
jgi:hypothetical protein